ncbi:MAG: restriction endonuclease [Ignavibacteriaceae bacterium]|jgi:restriction system protein|nr:restriction endonuclease [Ignavibacteriaceae bacterium]
MSIPDFQSLMLPLLKFCSDEQEHSTKDTINYLSKQFNLSENELSQLLPSGTQYVFYNRVFWAKAHLKMAGLFENTKRAHFKITQSGLNLLKTNPSLVNLRTLKTYPEYIEHTKTHKKDKIEKLEIETENDSELTPEESLEYSYQKIRKSLAQDLLSKIKNLSPSFFEKLVVELLVKMGYGGSITDAGKAIGRSGDEGIDGIIKEDKLGLDVIYIQAKRWQGVVGRPELQKFVGALAGQGAKKGIFITTSFFSKDALDYTPKNETKIVLIDGEQLAQYMIDFDLAVSTISTYQIKKIDLDYFGEE